MCGIAGLISAERMDSAIVRGMTNALAHRGPDDHGVWVDADAKVGLGHRRLSIVDLSPAGHEPMHSSSGRFVITFNGEIYNYRDLRSRLEQEGKVPPGGWRGHSDVEVLLEAIETWGLEHALGQATGMFAFALWDSRAHELSLVRDRFGEKPLYYGWTGKDFVFGSELKAIRAHPRFNNPISRAALGLFVARTYIPAPLSIYESLFKLEPGCILTVTLAGAAKARGRAPVEGALDEGVKLDRYWSYRDVVRRGFSSPIEDEGEALERLEQALAVAIKAQAVADVPVGAFLSGGIDSSTIVALYQKYSPIPVRSFSIGFEESGFDEAPHAKAVANYLGTIHNERYVTVKEARDVIPLLPSMYDEPFGDSSQIPTYLVSRFAREEVTVALSGDGGDELFAGYNRHFAAPLLWQRLQRMPRAARALIGAPLSQVPPVLWNVARGKRPPNFGAKVQKALRVAGSASTFDDVYNSFLDEWSFDRSPVLGLGQQSSRFDLDVVPRAPDALRTMYCDAVSYLPDDILCKVDRAAMAVSLETRVPFLDHHVAEIAAKIPLSMKVRGGRGKHILRELLYREAPRELFDRPKAGFAVPIGEWLKGPLRPWAEDLLDSRRMGGEGWFDPSLVHQRWKMHLNGRRDSTASLWTILMFQAWNRDQTEIQRQAA